MILKMMKIKEKNGERDGALLDTMNLQLSG